MIRFVFLGIVLLAALGVGGCVGETKLTEGAAAGAGIGALLGGSGGADAAEEEGEEVEASSDEDGLQYFGPVQ